MAWRNCLWPAPSPSPASNFASRRWEPWRTACIGSGSTPSATGPAGFCAHHTAAIENDLTFATNRTTLQAFTLATALWTRRCLHGIAARLGLTRPLFPPPAQLAASSAGRRGKEPLINAVAGFTGYQRAAHHRVPGHARRWAHQAAAQLRQARAPQRDWNAAGCGGLDRLIDPGGRLRDPGAPAALGEAAEAGIDRLAEDVALPVARMRAIALLSQRPHDLPCRAHGEPRARGVHLARVERLCRQFEPPG